MTDDTFQSAFANWKLRAESLDQHLHPIVHADVDTNAPDWQERLANKPHPADASGLRHNIQSLFSEIIDRFESFDANQRQHIIDLMDKHSSLMYSAVIDADFDTPEGFRKRMILFVIHDQGNDIRDAIVALISYRRHAEERGIDANSIFKEMVDIASTRNKYGWGTTRDLFLTY